MAERSYPLGNRRSQFKGTKGQFDPARFAWTLNNIGEFMILVNPVEDGSQAGPSVRIFSPIARRNYNVSWDLTGLTEDELVALKQIFDTAFEWALPVVQQRDKDAADAFERGDDSQIRVYRQVPQLVFRKRPEQEYGQSVLHRPENVSPVDDDGSTDPGSDSDGVLGSGDGVAERDEGVLEPEDDGSEVDQP